MSDQSSTSLANGIEELFNPVLEGAREDVKVFAAAVATDLAAAVAANRKDLVKECQRQARGLVEVNRLRVSTANKEVFDFLINRGIVALYTAIGGRMTETTTTATPLARATVRS